MVQLQRQDISIVTSSILPPQHVVVLDDHDKNKNKDNSAESKDSNNIHKDKDNLLLCQKEQPEQQELPQQKQKLLEVDEEHGETFSLEGDHYTTAEESSCSMSGTGSTSIHRDDNAVMRRLDGDSSSSSKRTRPRTRTAGDTASLSPSTWNVSMEGSQHYQQEQQQQQQQQPEQYSPTNNPLRIPTAADMFHGSEEFDAISSCETASATPSERGGGNNDTPELLAQNETKAVGWLRLVVIFVLTCSATGICVAAYYFVKSNEISDFETAFHDQASRVIDAFQINAQTRVGALEAFALSITSHAKFSNSTWPFVTLPDFERRGRATSELAEVMSMIMVPLVTDDTRDEWEAYSVANQGWFDEALDIHQQEDEERKRNDPGYRRQRQLLEGEQEYNAWAIPEEIYRVKGLRAAPELGPGPYLPQWQIAPIVPVPNLVNFNLLSHSGYVDSLTAVLEAQVAVVGRSFDFSDPNDEETAGRLDVFTYFLDNWTAENNGYDQDPVADIHVPLYDDYDKETRKMVGLLTCVVYWRTYFVDILPASAEGIIVVLQNTCDQKYTYKINGANVEYVGPGDQHDPKYDRFKVFTEDDAYLQVGDYSNAQRQVNGSCLYSVHVYPSEEFETNYMTQRPIYYTVVLVFIFLFTSAVFLIYDCLVERRQRVVMDTAVASNAIVSSLFPKVVRDRLYHGDGGSFRVNDQKKKQEHTIFSLPDVLQSSSSQGPPTVTTKNLKLEDSKPIADLFQDCTVLFADIVGFTSWSSGREPTEVFTLLERLYGALDKIAKRKNVFKVETIGDCYLAVTGLPEPQEDHAVIMANFANECMRQMRYLMARELRDLLGEETKDLSMRFGLHSGPVTAGVLRGEKSRFQLFGDTVNTAARMESTGMRGRIQLSQQTADCLIAAGKKDWCEPRDTMVEAKGKGKLQTYWLRLRRQHLVRRDSRSSSAFDSADKSQLIDDIGSVCDGMEVRQSSIRSDKSSLTSCGGDTIASMKEISTKLEKRRDDVCLTERNLAITKPIREEIAEEKV